MAVRKRMARLAGWGALVCVALREAAAEDGLTSTRQYPNEEVLASQRYYSVKWRDSFNKGDVEYCRDAYLEDAALHVDLGPAAGELEERLQMANPAILRGRNAITKFWRTVIDEVGLHDLRAYEESGAYSSVPFAVDDNTVIIRGELSFTTKSKAVVSGEIFSELWVRSGVGWKLKASMFALQEFQDSALSGVGLSEEAREEVREEVAKEVRAEEPLLAAEVAREVPEALLPAPAKDVAPGQPPPASGAAAAADSAGSEGDKEAGELGSEPSSEVGEGHGGEGVAEDVPVKTLSSSFGSIFTMIAVVVTCAVAACMVHRTRRRRGAKIAGFESMLG